jgi:CRP/FNR family transcriptional regulator, cyclic AMP receptor protein
MPNTVLPPDLKAQPRNPPQIITLLENTKWADNLSHKEVEVLAGYFRLYTAEKGSVIVSEGSREIYLCLLVDGEVRVVKQGDREKSKLLGSVGPGKTIGEMSLIDGEPRSASIIAEEPTTLLVLTGDDFQRLSSEVPRLAIKVLLKISKLLSQRLRQTTGALLNHLGG